MNFCITDGESVVATRYISSRKEAAASLVRTTVIIPEILLLADSLPQWFSSGTSFSEYAPGGHYKMFKEDKRENIIMVASEPLTFEKGGSEVLSRSQFPVSHLFPADWMEIKTNNMIVLTPKMNVLLIPIIDKFYMHPTDPGSRNRGTDFAAAKGLFSERWKVDVPRIPAPDSTTPQPVSPV